MMGSDGGIERRVMMDEGMGKERGRGGGIGTKYSYVLWLRSTGRLRGCRRRTEAGWSRGGMNEVQVVERWRRWYRGEQGARP